MTVSIVAIVVLVLLGSLLAMGEASITRVSLVHAITLREQGRRNGALLARIEGDPPRYLSSLYLSVMFAQNGSAVLVAHFAETRWGNLGVTVGSLVFTLLYFVLVEAMSKTFGVLNSDRVALALSPMVIVLARLFSLPVKVLIGLSNVLLPGRGLARGPYVSSEEIRQMAEAGHESGSIDTDERELIVSIFEFGDKTARDVMVPRPDMVVLEADTSPQEALDVAIDEGFSRIPVHDGEHDNIIGVLYEKDLVKALREPRPEDVRSLVRDAYFVPEAVKVSDLLREMKRRRMHMAIVADEHGDVAGLVTLEDILEEIVGEIADEYDEDEETPVVPLGSGWRVLAKTPIREFNEFVRAELPEGEDWQTVGGLVASVLGRMPEPGDEVSYNEHTFRVETMDGRRIDTVLVSPSP